MCSKTCHFSQEQRPKTQRAMIGEVESIFSTLDNKPQKISISITTSTEVTMSANVALSSEQEKKLGQNEMFKRLLWVDFSVSPEGPLLKWPALLFNNYKDVLVRFEKDLPTLRLVDISLHQLKNPECMNVPVACLLGHSNYELMEMDKGIVPSFPEFSLHLQDAMGEEIQKLRFENQELYLDFHRGIDKVMDIMSSARASCAKLTPTRVWLNRAESTLKNMKYPPPSTPTNEPDKEIGNNQVETSASPTVNVSQRKENGGDVDSARAENLDTGSKKNSEDLQASPAKETLVQSKINAENSEELSTKSETAKEDGRISRETIGTELSKNDSAGKPKTGKCAAAIEEDYAGSQPPSPSKVSMPSSNTSGDGATVVSNLSADLQIDDPIEPNETWESVLKKFEFSGFVKIDSGEFVAPNGNAPFQNGVKGRDYYDEEGLREMLREKFGWVGPPPSPTVGGNSSPSSNPSPASSEHHQKETPKKRKAKGSAPQAISASKRSRRPREAPANHPKRDDDDFFYFTNVWQYLENLLGWKYERSRCKLRDWCYVLPGRSEGKGKHMVDFFYEESEVVDYVKERYTKEQLVELEKKILQESSQQMDNIGEVRANTVSP